MGKKITGLIMGLGTLILVTLLLVMLAESQTMNLVLFNQTREYTIILTWVIFIISMTVSELPKKSPASHILLDMLVALIVAVVMYNIKGLWLSTWQNMEYYFKTIFWYGVVSIAFSAFLSDKVFEKFHG